MKNSTPGWQTSSRTHTNHCVEVKHDHTAVRDTKRRDGGALALDRVGMRGLVAFARAAGTVGAALALVVALVSSVEYVPPAGQGGTVSAASATERAGSPDIWCQKWC